MEDEEADDKGEYRTMRYFTCTDSLHFDFAIEKLIAEDAAIGSALGVPYMIGELSCGNMSV